MAKIGLSARSHRARSGPGVFALFGWPVGTSFIVIGDSAGAFFARLGMRLAGGTPLGVLLYSLIGLVLGFIWGIAVVRWERRRARTSHGDGTPAISCVAEVLLVDACHTRKTYVETHPEGKQPMDLDLYCDGASRGNPGPASVGIVVIDHASGAVLVNTGKPIGEATNNVAEYEAIKWGLAPAEKRYKASTVRVY
jgi:hypothetical protein